MPPKRRSLSELLVRKCEQDGLTFQDASLLMGEQPNAVARWVKLTVLPGPPKYESIAEFLGISIYDVGGAVALDQLERIRRNS